VQSLARADIFFLVTTIAVGLLTVGLVVAIVYLVRLLRSLQEIVTEVRAELATMNDYIDTQMKTPQSKFSSVALVAESLMKLYGSFTNPKTSKGKGISSKKK
jgi:uncharacterized membrane-anchored protein YhcB (DUF1043 family)